MPNHQGHFQEKLSEVLFWKQSVTNGGDPEVCLSEFFPTDLISCMQHVSTKTFLHEVTDCPALPVVAEEIKELKGLQWYLHGHVLLSMSYCNKIILPPFFFDLPIFENQVTFSKSVTPTVTMRERARDALFLVFLNGGVVVVLSVVNARASSPTTPTNKNHFNEIYPRQDGTLARSTLFLRVSPIHRDRKRVK